MEHLPNNKQSPGYVARAISDYLTSETGITIIFESAIVPKWKDSRLSFKNVYISRRPDTPTPAKPWKSTEYMAAVGYDVSNHPAYYRIGEDDDEPDITDLHDQDSNFTMFDLNIDSVDVTLSLKRWLDGKGLVEDAVVRGVRGVVGSYLLSKTKCVLTACSTYRSSKRFLGSRQSTRPSPISPHCSVWRL